MDVLLWGGIVNSCPSRTAIPAILSHVPQSAKFHRTICRTILQPLVTHLTCMGGLLTKRPQFPSEHMTKTKYLGMKCSGERNQTHTCSKQEPCCEVIVARSSAPLRPKTWLLFTSSVMYSQFCSINDKKANSTCAFLLWFYFFPLLMWKRNLLIYDCTLQHYIHIRKYIKKNKTQFRTLSTCYKIKPRPGDYQEQQQQQQHTCT